MDQIIVLIVKCECVKIFQLCKNSIYFLSHITKSKNYNEQYTLQSTAKIQTITSLCASLLSLHRHGNDNKSASSLTTSGTTSWLVTKWLLVIITDHDWTCTRLLTSLCMAPESTRVCCKLIGAGAVENSWRTLSIGAAWYKTCGAYIVQNLWHTWSCQNLGANNIILSHVLRSGVPIPAPAPMYPYCGNLGLFVSAYVIHSV
jgi:hypothetical protein